MIKPETKKKSLWQHITDNMSTFFKKGWSIFFPPKSDTAVTTNNVNKDPDDTKNVNKLTNLLDQEFKKELELQIGTFSHNIKKKLEGSISDAAIKKEAVKSHYKQGKQLKKEIENLEERIANLETEVIIKNSIIRDAEARLTSQQEVIDN
jgi:polyhydroxyalkanoate synthesis regulator phasin